MLVKTILQFSKRVSKAILLPVVSSAPQGNQRTVQMQLLAASALCLIAIGFSCKQGTAKVANDIVYYYPEKNIYYDSQFSRYYYSLNGARSWDSMSFTGSGFGAVLGAKIPLKRTSENVWQNNELHRQENKGMLLNIINDRTIFLAKQDSVNKTKKVVIVKAIPKVIEKKEEPVEKGLKKFFSKLFGKKKKPSEEKKQ